MKNWLIDNKNVIPFFLLFLLIQIINKFGNFDGQYAKIEVAIYLILIYIPIYIYNIKKIKFDNFNIGHALIIISPIFIEFIVNEVHGNRTYTAYYDLSIMAVSAILLINFLVIDKNLEQKNILLVYLIIIAALIITITTYLNILFNFDKVNINKGSFITGNQNISAYILLASLPFLIPLRISNLYKTIYAVLIIFTIGFIFKARLPTIISIAYGLYLIYRIFEIKGKKNYLALAFFIATTIFIIFLIFNDRFHSLFNYDFYYRLLPFLRLYDGLSLNNLIFGVGTANFGALFFSIQDIYPVLELMLPSQTFTYAHNFLIDRLVSAGIIIFLFYFIFYILIIIKYIKFKEKSLYIQALFHAFCIGLFMSLYDIVHNTISGYSIFTLITGLLIVNIFEIKIQLKKYFLILIMASLITPVILVKLVDSKGHQYDYNKIITLVNAGMAPKKEINQFSTNYPHYSEIDSLITYYMHFHEPSKLHDKDFKEAFLNMNKYNKYRNSRLHFSSQYYSLRNLDDDLVNVYADILFRSLILKKIVTPTYERKQIKVENTSDGNPNIKFISRPCCTLKIPQDMFKQIKYVNSGLTNLKITEESINFVATNTIYSIDSRDSARDTDVVKEFLREINKFSEPLKF